MFARPSSLRSCCIRVAPRVAHRLRSTWIPPKQRPLRRPLVNGQPVAFHVSDLHAQTDFQIRRTKSYESNLVVVLDMDECLIHSQFLDNSQMSVYAHQVKRTNQQQEQNGASVDSFRINLDNALVHVNMRPGVLEFLEFCTKRYETHVFTAALEVYAKPVLDVLSSKLGQDDIFSGRWYREHCTPSNDSQAYLKDLSKLQFDLSRTVLVDNNPASFEPQPSNGIFVPSFFTDPHDTHLETTRAVLEDIQDLPDVREYLKPVAVQQQQVA